MTPTMTVALGPRATATALPAEPVSVSAAQRRSIFMAASLLLDYPGPAFDDYLRAIGEIAPEFPQPIARSFAEFCSWANAGGIRTVEEAYVRTFDEKRRCALELSYYVCGDTRQRGQALVVFRELLGAVGFVQDDGELPDYLPMLLELCAKSDDVVVHNVLPAHRDGLEVLRHALLSLNSPWAGIVTAICSVLPLIDAATHARYQALIRQGPPSELVGIHDLPFPTLQEAHA